MTKKTEVEKLKAKISDMQETIRELQAGVDSAWDCYGDVSSERYVQRSALKELLVREAIDVDSLMEIVADGRRHRIQSELVDEDE